MTNSVTTQSMKVYTAEQVKESVYKPADHKESIVYLTYGKVKEWANAAQPDQANTSFLAQADVWDIIIGGKRITENDIEHVISRNQWTSGTVYNQYDDRDSDLFDRAFYVITTDYNVYKCISNNQNTVSTVEPTSQLTTTVSQTGDGYIWKYMYSLNSEDKYRFTNDDYFPVRTLANDNGTLQWDVQQNATDGAIYNIVIDAAGNYTTDNVTLTITGDGIGANAYATVNVTSTEIANVSIDDYGSGYTYIDIAISGGGGTGGGDLRAILPPYGGHGFDALNELGGSQLMVNARLRGTEDGLLPIVNDLRQISLVREPIQYGTSNVYTNSVFSMTKDLTLTGVSADYDNDEVVYQGDSLASASFSGTVVEYNSANSLIKVVNTEGTPTAAILTGANTGSTGFIASINYEDVIKRSGTMLYIDNIEEIKRNELQTENFRIVLKY